MNSQPHLPNKLITNLPTQTTSNQTHLYNKLFFPNKTNHVSPSPSPSQPTPTSQTPHPLNQLHIASLNTRGLNDDTKFKCLLQFIEIKNYSIFGISETKIKESSKKYLSNNNFTIHWSSTTSSQAGVALIINSTYSNTILKLKPIMDTLSPPFLTSNYQLPYVLSKYIYPTIQLPKNKLSTNSKH